MVKKGHSCAVGHRCVQTQRQCQGGCCNPFSIIFSLNRACLLWLYLPPNSKLETEVDPHPHGNEPACSLYGCWDPMTHTHTGTSFSAALSLHTLAIKQVLVFVFFNGLWGFYILSGILRKRCCFLQIVAYRPYKGPENSTYSNRIFFHIKTSPLRTVASFHLCLKSCQNNMTPASHANIYIGKRERGQIVWWDLIAFLPLTSKQLLFSKSLLKLTLSQPSP